ncbi:MAG: S8 family serine peptidase [Oscillospiraceae bacterium]|nr:S8 family serine peptidase [Oscillospiraceae bacterium]
MSNTACLDNLEHTAEDFNEINCKNIKNMTKAATNIVYAKLSGTEIAEQRNASSEYVTFSDYYDVNLAEFHQILAIELAEPGKENVLAAIKELEKRADVIYAGPNYMYQIEQSEKSQSSRIVVPWDDLIDDQWAINMINLPTAWEITTGGSRRVAVGIVDTGVDQTHPDLIRTEGSRASWEIDIHGDSSSVTIATDVSGHGTAMAGIIGAKTFNQGICGVNWNVEIISLNVYADDFGTSILAMIEAIEIATQQGIPILNISMALEWDSDVTTLISKVQQYPGLIVCTPGNEGENLDNLLDEYPWSIDSENVIVVGASTEEDKPWVSSNYHPREVDLFAPGENILCCYPKALCNETNCTSASHHSYGYHYGSGTSEAAPYVAGVASLIMSQYPNLTAAEVRARILNSVDMKSDFVGKCATGGRLNAYKALHDHTFNTSCEYTDSTHHMGYCACGVYGLSEHTWMEMDDYWYCTGCGYRQY